MQNRIQYSNLNSEFSRFQAVSLLALPKNMKTFRTLELSEKFYHQTESLRLSGNLRDQLTRASSSIALNLSEGNAKPSVKEKRRYYQTAYASLKECQTILKLAKIENEKINEKANFLGACLYKLTVSTLSVMPLPNERKNI